MEETSKRDLAAGVRSPICRMAECLSGRSAKTTSFCVRRGDEFFAVGATCTHYRGPLAEGLVVGDTVRCPWHHACFSLRTGEALRAPALDPIACWRVERVGDTVFVREKLAEPAAGGARPPRPRRARPRRSSSSAAAPRDWLPRRCCAGRATTGRSRCSAPTTRRRATGRTCRRTTSPAPRRTTGFRCARPSSTRSDEIELVLDARVVVDRRQRKARPRSTTAATLDFGALLHRDRRRAGAAANPGRRPAQVHLFCARSPTAGRSSQRPRREARGRRRRELHRPRGRRVAARARHRRSTSSRPDSVPLERVLGPEVGRFVRDAARGARRGRSTSATTVGRIDGRDGHAERRRRRSRPTSSSLGVGVRPATRPGGAGGPRDRPRHRGRRVPRDERARRLRRRRRRALARSAFRRADPRRALGRRRAPGAGRGAEHARPSASRSTPCRSSGASTTTSRSTTSATPRSGTPSRSTARSRSERLRGLVHAGGRALAVATIARDMQSLRAELAMEKTGLTVDRRHAGCWARGTTGAGVDGSPRFRRATSASVRSQRAPG